MPSPTTLAEFRSAWLPNVTTAGLIRVVELLEKASPLLIHGAFTRAMPMGCLATHIAWQHPRTAHLQIDAGVVWLTRVARLNPATSAVLFEWDKLGVADWELRDELLAACREELARRADAGEAGRGTEWEDCLTAAR
jgi:hypothetical protein